MKYSTMTLNDWKEKAKELFGDDPKGWKFKCPKCKESQSLQEFLDAKVDDPGSKFYYSCIGRWVENRGCDWTLGGLFQIHNTEVISEDGEPVPVFEFAEPDKVEA